MDTCLQTRMNITSTGTRTGTGPRTAISNHSRYAPVTKYCDVTDVEGRDPTTTGAYATVFPCHDPTSPLLRNYFTRLQSFKSWPGHIRARPEELAAAGLFYLGERDRSKCFYCNGGLQNWDFEDDPMIEHAKYFPHCEFVLQQKGPNFIAEINAKYPNIKRPGLSDANTQISQPLETSGVTQHDHATIKLLAAQRTPPISKHHQPTTSSYSNEDNIIEQAGNFGFDRNIIDIVIRKHHESGLTFSSLEELISAIIDQESANGGSMEDDEKMECFEPALCNVTPKQVAGDGTATLNLKNELQAALDESVCKICHGRERECVFMHCGHLCCCYNCGQKAKKCPLCEAKIHQVLRIYK